MSGKLGEKRSAASHPFENQTKMDEADHAHPDEHFLFTSESVGEGHPGSITEQLVLVLGVNGDRVTRN